MRPKLKPLTLSSVISPLSSRPLLSPLSSLRARSSLASDCYSLACANGTLAVVQYVLCVCPLPDMNPIAFRLCQKKKEESGLYLFLCARGLQFPYIGGHRQGSGGGGGSLAAIESVGEGSAPSQNWATHACLSGPCYSLRWRQQ